VIEPAHELLGSVLLERGEPDAAAREVEAALLRTPKRARPLAGLERARATP